MLSVKVQVLEGLLTSQPSVHVWRAKGSFSHYSAHGNDKSTAESHAGSVTKYFICY